MPVVLEVGRVSGHVEVGYRAAHVEHLFFRHGLAHQVSQRVVDCLSHNYTCKRQGTCASHGFWGELNNQIIAYLKATTIADLMNKQAILDDIVS